MKPAWIIVLGIVACSSPTAPPAPGSQGSQGPGPGSSDEEFRDAPKQNFTTDKTEIPDQPGWQHAVFVAINGWTHSFNKIEVTDIKVVPLKAPDGEIAKYVVRVVAKKGAETVFTGTAMVSRGVMLNSAGLPKLEAHFAALKFPKESKMHVGHLITELFLTKSIDEKWLRHLQPDAVSWDYDKPVGAYTGKPATLVYDDKGALLTVHRDGAAGAIERLEVRIDPNGLVTKVASRKVGDKDWEKFVE